MVGLSSDPLATEPKVGVVGVVAGVSLILLLVIGTALSQRTTGGPDGLPPAGFAAAFVVATLLWSPWWAPPALAFARNRIGRWVSADDPAFPSLTRLRDAAVRARTMAAERGASPPVLWEVERCLAGALWDGVRLSRLSRNLERQVEVDREFGPSRIGRDRRQRWKDLQREAQSRRDEVVSIAVAVEEFVSALADSEGPPVSDTSDSNVDRRQPQELLAALLHAHHPNVGNE